MGHFSGCPEKLFGALIFVNVGWLYQKHRFLRFSQRAYLGKIEISLGKTGIDHGQNESYHGKIEIRPGRIGVYHGKIKTSLGRIGIYHGEIETSLGRIGIYHGKIKTDLGRIGVYHGKIKIYLGRIRIYHGKIETFLGRIEIYHGKIEVYLGQIHIDQARTRFYQGETTMSLDQDALPHLIGTWTVASRYRNIQQAEEDTQLRAVMYRLGKCMAHHTILVCIEVHHITAPHRPGLVQQVFG